jgi:hypothetical protein
MLLPRTSGRDRPPGCPSIKSPQQLRRLSIIAGEHRGMSHRPTPPCQPTRLLEGNTPTHTYPVDDLAQIILIAGPSGSGKSTFFREYLSGGLAKDLWDCLPDEAKTWKSTSSNEISRKGLPPITGTNGGRPGLWLHYDIMRPFTKGFEHYANDPALQAVLAPMTALTVVNLVPSREVLHDQFLRRVWSESYGEPWEKKRFSTGASSANSVKQGSC